MSADHLLDATHDPALRSWVGSANLADSDFPIQNLPFGVFRPSADRPSARCGVAIGEFVVDPSRCTQAFDGMARAAAEACGAAQLNDFMALGPLAASALRAQLSALLSAASADGRALLAAALHPQDAVELLLPVRVAGYTDFFASIHHATNAGRLFRPDMPLLPNYKHVPVAYNGRARSIRLSGETVQRPWGQTNGSDDAAPVFRPADRLDYEVELGAFVGAASSSGVPIAVGKAWEHVFGFCLLNDWSARDIQAWEYQPLGPFLAKSFATSISPWIVTADALTPFRRPVAERPAGDPAPLGYLRSPVDARLGALGITLEAHLRSAAMATRGQPAERLSRASASTLYWTIAQMLAHHSSNGGAMDTGDLIGTGTVSGPTEDALGSLLELSRGGRQPVPIGATGETRRWLEDGDQVTLTGYCERPGFVRIGFGHCTATLGAAHKAVKEASA